MTFEELIATNPPRLAIEYQRGPNNDDNFRWGVVGDVPMLTLIGALSRAQQDIVHSNGFVEPCDPSTFVLAWDKEYKDFSCFVNFSIPQDSLLGMLEVIKGVLVGSRLAAQAQAVVSPIVGLDGKPLRR